MNVGAGFVVVGVDIVPFRREEANSIPTQTHRLDSLLPAFKACCNAWGVESSRVGPGALLSQGLVHCGAKTFCEQGFQP